MNENDSNIIGTTHKYLVVARIEDICAVLPFLLMSTLDRAILSSGQQISN